jgi:hypothetical protein
MKKERILFELDVYLNQVSRRLQRCLYEPALPVDAHDSRWVGRPYEWMVSPLILSFVLRPSLPSVWIKGR